MKELGIKFIATEDSDCKRVEMEEGIIPIGENVELEYDEGADVLYISFGKPKPAIGVDLGGVILRYDEKEKKIVGMTIIGLREILADLLVEKEREKKK